MSIADEISRLLQAKADIKIAIEGKGVTVSGTATLDEYPDYIDDIPQGGGGNLQQKSVTPSETAQQVTPDSEYDGLSEVDVAAIPSDYVGSGVTRRSSTDLTASGATVNVPAGYYASQGSKAVASGTAGTPSATKGTVSNHSVSVTPQVTNTEGYIASGTKTGTAVNVSASELVSGNRAITSNGTNIDVANYATVSVDVSGGGGSLQSKSVTITQNGTTNVTPDTGYDGLSDVEIIADVAGGASNFVMGTFTTVSTRGSTGSFTIPYTGSGYPIAMLIFIQGGLYNNTASGNTTWYNSNTRYDCGFWSMVKCETTSVPGYGTSGNKNNGSIAFLYRNSGKSTFAYSGSLYCSIYRSASSPAISGGTSMCRFVGNGTTVKYYTGNGSSSNIGFPPDTEMQYIVVYSS